MRDVARVLKKQKQLIEIELGQAKMNERMGFMAIHPDKYYTKLKAVLFRLNKCIQLLDSTEEDIYENFDFVEN